MSTQIPDGDLVRLARDGDPAAFRLLVERHQPMARTRAWSLCGNPSDVDDVVQESFLRAFVGLDRLRDPDRFAGWLGGIVANVCGGLRRRSPVVLLPDWPEPLHPAAADGPASAEDLDRADAVRAAIAGLPAGQRRAVTLHYYADLPAAQIAEPAGAARASLHKARLRLRAYLTEHRPDLVPASRRNPMTTVRIAGTERRIPPGPVPIGFPSYVVVLADDAGRRALPIWLEDIDSRRLTQPVEPPSANEEHAQTTAARTVDELTVRLLSAANASVTGVDINDLGPDMPAAARISLTGPAGTRRVSARVAEALAVAITAGAPVRVADTVLDRLAVPLTDDGAVPLPEPTAALAVLSPGRHPRYEPRNLAFAEGLDGWLLGGTFTGHASHSHWQDYSGTAAEGFAVLTATVSRPAGFAFLSQEMFADDYRGDLVTFRGQFRTRDTTGTDTAGTSTTGTGNPSRAGLFLRVISGRGVARPITERAAVSDPANNLVTVPSNRDWASHQVTARIPEDANTVIFGVFLAGHGQIELRNAEFVRGT